MTRQTLNILKSPEVIAINQDPLGIPGDLVWKQGPQEVAPHTCHFDKTFISKCGHVSTSPYIIQRLAEGVLLKPEPPPHQTVDTVSQNSCIVGLLLLQTPAF
jgi:hypothetical protein